MSVVGANYGLGYRNLGTVGVSGRLRMDYATAIASVREAAGELSRFFEIGLRALVTSATTTSCSGSSAMRPARRRSRRRSGASPATCIPTSTAHDPEAEEKFKPAAEAYEVLSDPERRRTYDPSATRGCAAAAGRRTRPGSAASRTSSPRSSAAEDRAFGDLFGSAGGRGPGPGGDIARRGRDHARRGAHRGRAQGHLRGGVGLRALPRQRRRAGDADPHLRDLRRRRAGAAGPSHRLRPARPDRGLPELRRRRARSPSSPASGATGPGASCGERTWDVEVPAGIESGQRIRIAGAGPRRRAGRAAGRPLRRVVVVADDALRAPRPGPGPPSVSVPVTLAMVGGRSTVPTLDGEREVKIPAGTQPGHTIAAQGARPAHRCATGTPRRRSTCVIDVEVPRKLNREQRKARQAAARVAGRRRPRVIRLAVRCRAELGERVLAELLELARAGSRRSRAAGWVEYAIYGPPGRAARDPGPRGAAGRRPGRDQLDRDPRRLGRPLARLPPAGLDRGGRLVVRPSWAESRAGSGAAGG